MRFPFSLPHTPEFRAARIRGAPALKASLLCGALFPPPSRLPPRRVGWPENRTVHVRYVHEHALTFLCLRYFAYKSQAMHWCIHNRAEEAILYLSLTPQQQEEVHDAVLALVLRP